MLQALKDAQRKKAILNFSKTGNNNLTEAFKDNVVLDYAGLRTDEFADPAPATLAGSDSPLRRQHGRRSRPGEDGRGRRHLDQTWFTWIGGTEPDSAFYYRIHSPVVLIEFDHQRPANLRNSPPIPEADPAAHSLRSPNSEWQRLRQGFASAALSGPSTHDLSGVKLKRPF